MHWTDLLSRLFSNLEHRKHTNYFSISKQSCQDYFLSRQNIIIVNNVPIRNPDENIRRLRMKIKVFVSIASYFENLHIYSVTNK